MVAGPTGARAGDLHVEQLGAEEVQRRLHLGLVDELALPGAVAVVERRQQRRVRKRGATVSV